MGAQAVDQEQGKEPRSEGAPQVHCIFQVICKQDGRRSAPFTSERSKLGEGLRELLDKHPEHAEDYVLVLADVFGKGDFQVSQSPLFTIEDFVRHFRPEV